MRGGVSAPYPLPPKALGIGAAGRSVEDTVPSRGLAHSGEAQTPAARLPVAQFSSLLAPTPRGPALTLHFGPSRKALLFSLKRMQSLCPNTLEFSSLVPTASILAQNPFCLDDSRVSHLRPYDPLCTAAGETAWKHKPIPRCAPSPLTETHCLILDFMVLKRHTRSRSRHHPPHTSSCCTNLFLPLRLNSLLP